LAVTANIPGTSKQGSWTWNLETSEKNKDF